MTRREATRANDELDKQQLAFRQLASAKTDLDQRHEQSLTAAAQGEKTFQQMKGCLVVVCLLVAGLFVYILTVPTRRNERPEEANARLKRLGQEREKLRLEVESLRHNLDCQEGQLKPERETHRLEVSRLQKLIEGLSQETQQLRREVKRLQKFKEPSSGEVEKQVVFTRSYKRTAKNSGTIYHALYDKDRAEYRFFQPELPKDFSLEQEYKVLVKPTVYQGKRQWIIEKFK